MKSNNIYSHLKQETRPVELLICSIPKIAATTNWLISMTEKVYIDNKFNLLLLDNLPIHQCSAHSKRIIATPQLS